MLHALTTHHVPLSPDLRDAIHSIGTKHTLYTRGVLKGRDVSRALIATKNERIAELQDVIAGLRAERELNRALIRHLRRAPDGKDAGGGRGSRDGEGGG